MKISHLFIAQSLSNFAAEPNTPNFLAFSVMITVK